MVAALVLPWFFNFLVVVLAAATLTPHDRCGPGFGNFRTLLLLLDVTSQFPELLDFGPESPVVFCNCTSASHIRVVAFSALLAACNWRGGGCDDVDECCCVAHSFSQLFRLASGNSHGGAASINVAQSGSRVSSSRLFCTFLLAHRILEVSR